MNEEQGHGELFGAMIESRINDHFAKTKRQRSPLAKKLKSFTGRLKEFIEENSPVVLIPCRDGPRAYYGSMVPHGYAAVVVFEEPEKTGEAHKISFIGGELRKDDAKRLGAKLKEHAKKLPSCLQSDKNMNSTVLVSIAEIVQEETLKEKTARHALPSPNVVGDSEFRVSRALHSLYGYTGVTEAACEMIDDGIVPAYIIFLMRPAGVYAIFAPFLYAMPPEVEASIEALNEPTH